MSKMDAVKDEAAAGVRAFDREGREVIVPRERWANEVLPAMVRQAWDEPEELYPVIVNSLNEGFVAEVTEAAAHLHAIDPVAARGACMWAAVLIRLERLVEAELVLTGCVDTHGENGPVLATLAQVCGAKGEAQRAQATLERAHAAGLPEQGVQIGMVRVDGPVWLPVGSPARGLFPVKAAEAPAVTFLGGSAEAEAEGQPSDELARMTRALPLYLAEQTEMRTGTAGRAILPWAVAVPGVRPGGFVVSGQRWPAETAVQATRDPANGSEYVVTVHVDAEVEPWEATLEFLRVSDGAQIGELSAEFAPGSPEDGLPGLADEVVELLSALGAAEAARGYVVPDRLGAYLAGLEHLLALRCEGMAGGVVDAGTEVREALARGLELCAAEPENVPARLLLLETLGAAGRGRPEAGEEFRERVAQLNAQRPIAGLEVQFS